MEPLITKANFPAIVRVTPNIKDDQINPYIEEVQVYDLPEKFSEPLLNALYALPATPPDPETQPELRAFYNKFVVRLAVLLAYIRMFPEHGINFTQFGLTVTKDPQGTMEPIDDKARSRVLANKKSDANVTLARMNKYLSDVKYTFDGVYYGQSTGPSVKPSKPSIGITPIRAKDTETELRRTYVKRFL